MSIVTLKGFVRNGNVEVEEPINLSDSAEVTITGLEDMAAGDRGRPVEDVVADLRARHQLPKYRCSAQQICLATELLARHV